MRRYEHGGDVYSHENIRLDYSVNLNPLGMPPEVKDAIVSHVGEFEAYPDATCRALTRAIALREGVSEDRVLCGNGAADLIFRVCLAQKPKCVLTPAPTFSEYERAARLWGSKVVYHRLPESGDFALSERILDNVTPEIDILFLCNPNNPTGNLADPALMARIARRCKKTGTGLLVDECFLPFTEGESLLPLTDEIPNLMILRSFTKLYAMAGVRLGYVLSGSREAIKAAGENAPCWSVSAVAQTAGLAALQLAGWETRTRRLIAAERRYLAGALNGFGIQVFDSEANFLLIKTDVPLYEKLLGKGILIRRCENYEGLDGRFYRLGIKLHPQNETLLHAIMEVLHG